MNFRIFYSLLFMLLLLQPVYAANYVVRSTADAGTHTLRWAILQSNANPGPDIITFDISGDGPRIISLGSALPPLSDPAGVIIDGLSQPHSGLGKHPPATMRLRIVIDGRRAGNTPGIWVHSPSNQVKGLVINNFAEEGIRIQAIKSGTRDNVIRHCIIGLDANGVTVRPNGGETLHTHWAGISIVSYSHAPGLAYDNLVFGNVISGNTGEGVLLSDCKGGRIYSNTISGNYIGSTLAGKAAAGNQRDGILLMGGCYGNTLSGNMIVGNAGNGIHLVGDITRNAKAHHNIVRNNVIGMTFDNKQLENALNGISIGGPEPDYPGGFASDNTLRE
ncbi:MAG: right-handed parallel beta-helix repeat-containing protein, partial [Bacteroidetes bacterium]|nr:right-handed parallel beta-helix repeat-containing protein [Bacteroidota bacterium]